MGLKLNCYLLHRNAAELFPAPCLTPLLSSSCAVFVSGGHNLPDLHFTGQKQHFTHAVQLILNTDTPDTPSGVCVCVLHTSAMGPCVGEKMQV